MNAPTRRHRRRRQVNWQALLGVVLLVALAYITTAQYRSGEQAQRRGECQAAVNATFLDALVDRDVANRELTAAQRDLILAPSREDNPTARAAANRRYLGALDQQTRSRQEHPLPEISPC